MKKTIMLACAAGMSTSLMMQKMEDAALEQNKEYKFYAVPATEAEKFLASNHVDVILLGPQLSYMIEDFERLVQKKVPIRIIDMIDYGVMDGVKVLAYAEKAMGL